MHQIAPTDYIKGAATSKRVAAATYEVTLLLERPLEFEAGQYVSLRIPRLRDTDPLGPSRDFSITSQPGEDRLTLLMRSSSSPFKQSLLQSSMPVDVQIRGPFGFFTLPDNEPLIGIAGGVGVAPFISMLRAITNHRSTQKLHLLTFDSDPERIAHQDLIRNLTNDHPNVHATRRVGRVSTSDELRALLPAMNRDTNVYLAGPPALTGPLRELVRQLGVSPLRILQEEFTGYLKADE